MPGEYSPATLAAHFDATNRRLAEIEAQLSRLSEKVGLPYVNPTASVPPDVLDLARGGDQLGAMKRYRELTGATMDEARSVVAGL
jgi:ribosomal protein L7/L12